MKKLSTLSILPKPALSRALVFAATAAAISGFSVNASAAAMFRPMFTYTTSSDDNGSTRTTTSRQLVDLAGGYITDGGWTIVGLYAIEGRKTEVKSGGGPTSTSDGSRTSMGIGGGWISKEPGPYATAVYHLQSQYAIGGTTYKGTGFQADLGLKVAFKNVFVNVQLTYRSFEYKETNGGALSSPLKHSNFDPMIGLQMEF